MQPTTSSPTGSPSLKPSKAPTDSPSSNPTPSPSDSPSARPTASPSNVVSEMQNNLLFVTHLVLSCNSSLTYMHHISSLYCSQQPLRATFRHQSLEVLLLFFLLLPSPHVHQVIIQLLPSQRTHQLALLSLQSQQQHLASLQYHQSQQARQVCHLLLQSPHDHQATLL